MSFFLRLFGFVVLLPSLAHAASFSLGPPKDGDKLSGVSVISGWKCEANGPLTVRFFTADGDPHPVWMDPIPLVYGTERTDVRENGECLENDHDNVGFAAIWNWGNLGDGQHTAVVYDDGVEFARSTVTVTTPGKSFLTGASKRVTVDDFPNPGDITVLEWNQGTQHFEIVDFMGSEPIDLGECVEGLMLAPGEMCMGSLLGFDFTVSVNEAGEACIDTGGLVPNVDMCYPDPASLPDIVSDLGIEATKHADGSWTIDSLPTGP